MTFTGMEFDITDVIDVVEPIQEDSFNAALSETVLEDQGVTYTVLERGSQKGKPVLVSNLGYAYSVKTDNKKSGTVTWRCSSRSKAVRCPVTISRRGDHFVQKREHMHAAVPDQELRHQAYSKARATAKTGVFVPARTIAENILTEECGEDDVARPRVNLLKRAVNHARSRLRPKEPDTLDFEVDADFINSDEFLVKDIQFDAQRHFVFATAYQLDILRQAKRWFVDGTFKVIGEPFKRSGQLFTINAFVEREGASKQLPLVFVLMSRRTQADYELIFRAVVERIGNVEVEGFVADFEVAVWNAVRAVFPGRDMKGCAFHWSQAVWRRVQHEGLAEVYRRRGGVLKFIRMLMALQFLPAPHIPRAFETLFERATTDATRRLVDYISRQWVHGGSFEPSDWSVFRQDVRTNNDLEGYHNRLNGKAGSGVGFYRLVPHLRQESEMVRLLIEGSELHRITTTRSAKVQKSLVSLWDKYEARECTTSEFLAMVGQAYGVVLD